MQSFETLIQVTSLIHNTEPSPRTDSELKVLDKFSGETIAIVNQINKPQMEGAIESCLSGFETLRSMSTGERRELLKKFHSLIEKNKEGLCDLVVRRSWKTSKLC